MKNTLSKLLILLVLAFSGVALAQHPTAQVAKHPTILKCDGVSVTLGTTNVLTIAVDGIPFSGSNKFDHMYPRWAGTYYEYRRDTTLPLSLKSEVLPDRQVASFEMHSHGHELTGKQTFQVGPGRTAKVSVDVSSTTEAETLYENMIGDLNPAWFAGRPYTVKYRDGSTTSSIFPFAPPEVDDNTKLCFAQNFESLIVQTPNGPLEIETTGTPAISMLDYRKSPFPERSPLIWIGVLGHDFNNYAHESYSVTFHFPPTVKLDSAGKVSFATKVNDTKDALTSKKFDDIVVPTPKEMRLGNGAVEFGKDTPIVITGISENAVDSNAFMNIGKSLQKNIKDKFNIEVPLKKASQKANAEKAIVLAYRPELSSIVPEGYTVKAAENTVTAEANTTEGLLNAVRTLRQLLRPATGEGAFAMRRADINDYPSMPFRGLYFNTGKNAVKEQEAVITNLMSDLKMNALVYSVTFAEWTSRPELTKPLVSMSLDDLKKIADICKRENIELIPTIPTYGLKEWYRYDWVKAGMIGQPVHGQWNNPPEQEALEAILDEAINLLHPKTMLICHDELEVSKEEVLASIKHWHEFLGKRGVRTAIWSDLFLTRDEGPDATNCKTQADADWMRAELPKDVLIFDWHYAYAKAEAFKSLKIWNTLGFDTIASTGNSRMNILPFCKAVTDERKNYPDTKGKSLGMIVTTWCGRNFDKNAMDKNSNVLASYVLGAEAAWTGGTDNPKDVSLDYVSYFENIWTQSILPNHSTDGWTLDLVSAQTDNDVAKNSFLSLKAKDGKWLAYTTGEDLSDFPSGLTRLGRFEFAIPENKTALLIPGQLDGFENAPTEVDLSCNGKKADIISFLTAATRTNSDNSPIAKTHLIYEDGTQASFDWVMGANIYSLEDARKSVNTPLVWRAGKGVTSRNVHVCSWRNPFPEKKIRTIKTVSAQNGAGLLLFGITGINEKTN